MSKSLIIIGLILSLVATVFLFLGSRHLPWDMQSIGGGTDKEIAFYISRQREVAVGFVLLFFGFLLQLIGVIKQK